MVDDGLGCGFGYSDGVGHLMHVLDQVQGLEFRVHGFRVHGSGNMDKDLGFGNNCVHPGSC